MLRGFRYLWLITLVIVFLRSILLPFMSLLLRSSEGTIRRMPTHQNQIYIRKGATSRTADPSELRALIADISLQFRDGLRYCQEVSGSDEAKIPSASTAASMESRLQIPHPSSFSQSC